MSRTRLSTPTPAISLLHTELFRWAVGLGTTFIILGLSCGVCTLSILRRQRRYRLRMGITEPTPAPATATASASTPILWSAFPGRWVSQPTRSQEKEVELKEPLLWEVEGRLGDNEAETEIQPFAVSLSPSPARLDYLIILPDDQISIGSTRVFTGPWDGPEDDWLRSVSGQAKQTIRRTAQHGYQEDARSSIGSVDTEMMGGMIVPGLRGYTLDSRITQ